VTRKLVSDKKTLSWHPYHTRLNFEFEIVNGKMTKYMIQLEYNADSYAEPDWKQVARSDTAHEFFHIDLHYTDGVKEKQWSQFPQNLPNAKEYRLAKGYLVRNEYDLLRKTGYVNGS
jgi:hypothetical protein